MKPQVFNIFLSFFFIQKRHKADSVVNKKECQGIENSLVYQIMRKDFSENLLVSFQQAV